jgi:hypothetical protein
VKAFLRHWVGMLLLSALMVPMLLAVWGASAVIDHFTQNLALGFVVLFVVTSLLVAVYLTVLFSPRGSKWVVTALGRWMQ